MKEKQDNSADIPAIYPTGIMAGSKKEKKTFKSGVRGRAKLPTYQEKQKEGLGCHADRQNTVWYEEIRAKCKHRWKPLSFVFETQMLDSDGRVLCKQPDISSGRVYCVCMRCCSHTFIETGNVGYILNSPDLLERRE